MSKNLLELRKELRNMADKLKEDDTLLKFNRWKASVVKVIALIFGQNWRSKFSEIAPHLSEAMSGNLRDSVNTDIPIEIGDMMVDYDWDYVMDHIENYLPRELRSESEKDLTNLMEGKIRQGESSLSQYYQKFRQAVRNLPELTTALSLEFFRTNLAEKHKSHALWDEHGRTFKNVNDLYNHLQRREAVEKSTATNRSLADRLGRSNFRNYRGTGKTFYPRSVHFADHVPNTSSDKQGPTCEEEERPAQGRRIGEGSSRGGRGGRGSFGRGGLREMEQTSWSTKQPDFAKDGLKKPCHLNAMISNAQAIWLQEQRRCYFCFRTLRECRSESPSCSQRKQLRALDVNQFPDAPKWD
jgi:hypothetical protein